MCPKRVHTLVHAFFYVRVLLAHVLILLGVARQLAGHDLQFAFAVIQNSTHPALQDWRRYNLAINPATQRLRSAVQGGGGFIYRERLGNRRAGEVRPVDLFLVPALGDVETFWELSFKHLWRFSSAAACFALDRLT